jgi:hypothetical protein
MDFLNDIGWHLLTLLCSLQLLKAHQAKWTMCSTPTLQDPDETSLHEDSWTFRGDVGKNFSVTALSQEEMHRKSHSYYGEGVYAKSADGNCKYGTLL